VAPGHALLLTILTRLIPVGAILSLYQQAKFTPDLQPTTILRETITTPHDVYCDKSARKEVMDIA
jgi:hypothetical protein